MAELYLGSMYLLYQLTYLAEEFLSGCSKAPQISGTVRATKRAAYQFFELSDLIIESRYLSIIHVLAGQIGIIPCARSARLEASSDCCSWGLGGGGRVGFLGR